PTLLLFPYTTLFRSLVTGKVHATLRSAAMFGKEASSVRIRVSRSVLGSSLVVFSQQRQNSRSSLCRHIGNGMSALQRINSSLQTDRKSTRLNSSHVK